MNLEGDPASRKRRSGSLAKSPAGSAGSIQGKQPNVSGRTAVDGTIADKVADQVVSAELAQIASLPQAVAEARAKRADEYDLVSRASYSEILKTSPLVGLLNFVISS